MEPQIRCRAVNKTKPKTNSYDNVRCKKNHKPDSIFCASHITSKPFEVVLNLKDKINFSIEDLLSNRNPWTIVKYTTEEQTLLDIQGILDNIEKEERERERLELEAFYSIKTCKVCYIEVSNNSELIRCSRANNTLQHLVCLECMENYFKSLISDGIGTNTCMFDKSDNCCGEYSNLEINKVLTVPEKQLEWYELVNTNEIYKLACICDDYVICPLCCKWGCIFEIPPGAQNNFYIPCSKCNNIWCNMCKRKSHGGRSCYNFVFEENETDEKKIELITHMIQEIVSKTLTHCCSTCGCAYIKEEGCNLMLCAKCNSMSCYLCNMKLYYKNDTKYWHFVGHELSDPDAECALWNNVAGDGKEKQGNTEFNLKSIKKSLIHFINENRDNIETLDLINTQINIIFGKDKEYTDMVEYFKTFITMIKIQIQEAQIL